MFYFLASHSLKTVCFHVWEETPARSKNYECGPPTTAPDVTTINIVDTTTEEIVETTESDDVTTQTDAPIETTISEGTVAENSSNLLRHFFIYFHAYNITLFTVEEIQNIEAETTTAPTKAKAQKKKFGMKFTSN